MSDTICNRHNTIIASVKQIKKLLKDNPVLLVISEQLDDINTEARYALKSGQRMEKRMLKYRRAIESLGFTRAKRKKK